MGQRITSILQRNNENVQEVAIANSNAKRDIQVAGIEADAQKNINYEQQQTQRMAIKAQEKVKLR